MPNLAGGPLLPYPPAPPSIFIPSNLIPSSYIPSFAAAAAMSAAMSAVTHRQIQRTVYIFYIDSQFILCLRYKIMFIYSDHHKFYLH